MKNLIRGTVFFYTLAWVVSLSAQTADEIVQKYLTAIGGTEAISKVKSISLESSAQIMGNNAPSTTVILDGVGYKTETTVNGTKIVSCYTQNGGWMVNPMAGAAEPTPMPQEEYNLGRGQIYVGGSLYDYAAKGSKVELLDKDANTYRLKLTSRDNVETLYVFDAATGLAKSVSMKAKMQDQELNITTNLSDYRKTELGYLLPYAIDVDFGGQFTMSIAVKNVELNKPIDPAIFEMPKAPVAPAQTNKPI